MDKQFKLYGVSCEKCKGDMRLSIKINKINIESLKAECKSCGWSLDLREKAGKTYVVNKEKAKTISKRVAKSITHLKDTLPRNKEELKQAIKNPRHPFTAALLTGLLLLVMELSGVGVFLALTWILGNLILNPLAWVLIPTVVAIVIAYRNYFKREKVDELRKRLNELEEIHNKGDLSREKYEQEKEQLLSEYFK